MILTQENTSNKIIATINNEDLTETYECKMAVCPNPVCTCGVVSITLTPIPGDSEHIPQTTPKTVKIDLTTESLADYKDEDVSQETLDFADDFIKQLQKDDYRLLQQELFARKSHLTETADLASIDANFPLEKIENESVLVAYSDILPFGKQLMVTVDNQKYLVFDQYCVRTNCSCTDTVLSFFPLDEGIDRSHPTKEVLTYFANYKKRTWDLEGHNKIDEAAARQALKEQYPKIYKVLQNRHKQLKVLYANYRKRNRVSQQPVSLKKAKRNDPCPCGSGKKYKSCCMRQKRKPDTYTWRDDKGINIFGKGTKR